MLRPPAQAEELIDTAEFIDGEWGDPQTVTFNQRDLLLYAVGIGCTEMKFICVLARPLSVASCPTWHSHPPLRSHPLRCIGRPCAAVH